MTHNHISLTPQKGRKEWTIQLLSKVLCVGMYHTNVELSGPNLAFHWVPYSSGEIFLLLLIAVYCKTVSKLNICQISNLLLSPLRSFTRTKYALRSFMILTTWMYWYRKDAFTTLQNADLFMWFTKSTIRIVKSLQFYFSNALEKIGIIFWRKNKQPCHTKSTIFQQDPSPWSLLSRSPQLFILNNPINHDLF